MINVKEYPFVIRQDSNSQPPITGSPGLEYKASFNFFLKNGPIPASFLFIFDFSTCYNSNLNWKKHRWCAWDSNPGRQVGRHERIHWATAAPHSLIFKVNYSRRLELKVLFMGCTQYTIIILKHLTLKYSNRSPASSPSGGPTRDTATDTTAQRSSEGLSTEFSLQVLSFKLPFETLLKQYLVSI